MRLEVQYGYCMALVRVPEERREKRERRIERNWTAVFTFRWKREANSEESGGAGSGGGGGGGFEAGVLVCDESEALIAAHSRDAQNS